MKKVKVIWRNTFLERFDYFDVESVTEEVVKNEIVKRYGDTGEIDIEKIEIIDIKVGIPYVQKHPVFQWNTRIMYNFEEEQDEQNTD